MFVMVSPKLLRARNFDSPHVPFSSPQNPDLVNLQPTRALRNKEVAVVKRGRYGVEVFATKKHSRCISGDGQENHYITLVGSILRRNKESVMKPEALLWNYFFASKTVSSFSLVSRNNAEKCCREL